MQNSSHGRSIAAASVLRYRSQPYLPRWFSTATVRRMSADATVTPSARRLASRLRIDDTTIQALVALTAGAALLRFLALSTQSYWYDEAITVELVRRPFSGMLGAVPQSESTPPLYYVLAWIWSQIFGTDEAGLRSLSAALGTAAVPATYAAGRQFVSRRSAFVAAALVAVSPLLVWYSQEARAYALLVLLGALSLIPLRQAAGLPGRPTHRMGCVCEPGARDALFCGLSHRCGGGVA